VSPRAPRAEAIELFRSGGVEPVRGEGLRGCPLRGGVFLSFLPSVFGAPGRQLGDRVRFSFGCRRQNPLRLQVSGPSALMGSSVSALPVSSLRAETASWVSGGALREGVGTVVADGLG
jgi:hypothetical protein